MANFSFIHCSDLHLGCQQFNNLVRWEDFGESFAHIVNFALERKVDFMLIGGDLFHHRSINARTLGVAMDLLGKLKEAGIRVFAIEGNHDKAFYLDEESWMGFLNQQGYINLLKPVFMQGRLQLTPYNGSDGCMVEMDGLKIIGLGYLGATTRQRLEEASAQLGFGAEVHPEGKVAAHLEDEAAVRLEDEAKAIPSEVEAGWQCDTLVSHSAAEQPFTIILLHAAVDKLLGQDLAGVGKEAFESFKGKVDYFALGHIHGRQEYADFIYNPGAPECVHIDEVRNNREKGFYYVRVEGKTKEVDFFPSSRRSVFYYDVDLTGTKLPEDAADRTFKKIGTESFTDDTRPIVQVVLHGTVGYSSFAIDTNLIAEQIKERYGCLVAEVINNTNLLQGSENGAYSSFDREAVERLVISGLLEQEKPELSHMQEELTGMVINLKNSLLAGAAGKDIIWAVEDMVGKLPRAEAAPVSEAAAAAAGEGAPAGEEGTTNED